MAYFYYFPCCSTVSGWVNVCLRMGQCLSTCGHLIQSVTLLDTNRGWSYLNSKHIQIIFTLWRNMYLLSVPTELFIMSLIIKVHTLLLVVNLGNDINNKYSSYKTSSKFQIQPHLILLSTNSDNHTSHHIMYGQTRYKFSLLETTNRIYFTVTTTNVI